MDGQQCYNSDECCCHVWSAGYLAQHTVVDMETARVKVAAMMLVMSTLIALVSPAPHILMDM